MRIIEIVLERSFIISRERSAQKKIAMASRNSTTLLVSLEIQYSVNPNQTEKDY